MDISAGERRRAFSFYLRTGRWPRVLAPDDREVKFNPYHDPRNGQFTFAPGGSRSVRNVIVTRRKGTTGWKPPAMEAEAQRIEVPPGPDPVPGVRRVDAVYRPDDSGGRLIPVGGPPNARGGRGGNIGRFYDPQTLQQAFPGLAGSPAGAIVAAADNLFDFQGPAREATRELTRNYTKLLIADIKALDPSFEFNSLAEPVTQTGQLNQLNTLRFIRAVKAFRASGGTTLLQLETTRFIQQRADRAYEEGVMRLEREQLKIRLSDREALGNFVDREVRRELRSIFKYSGIDAAGPGPVRVNRNENPAELEGSSRRPDARVGNIAFDVTLTAKTMKTPQVRGFFQARFQPTHVIIIRPRQIGKEYTYIISREEGNGEQ